jgi:RND superfamily putative drug exporter
MELLGDRNWWLPKWLDRILPRIDVEGHAAQTAQEEQPVGSEI